jgi:hypothetical protein
LCYCFEQNCHEDSKGIGCWKCVELASKGKQPSADMRDRMCRFDCDICGEKCQCQVSFDNSKHQTIATAICSNENYNSKKASVKNEEGIAISFLPHHNS